MEKKIAFGNFMFKKDLKYMQISDTVFLFDKNSDWKKSREMVLMGFSSQFLIFPVRIPVKKA